MNKRIFALLLMVLMLANAYSFASATNEQDVILPIGNGDGFIAYEYLGNEIVGGPISFVVLDNGNIYILDDVDKQVEVFDKRGNSIQTINLDKAESYFDLEVRANENIVLLTYSSALLEYDKHGQLINRRIVEGLEEKHINMVQLISTKGNDIVLRNHLDGTETNIDTNMSLKKYDSIELERTDDKKMKVTVDDISFELNYIYGVGNTVPLAHTYNNKVVMLQTDVSMTDKIRLEEQLIRVNKKNGCIEYSLIEKTDSPYYPEQKVYVNKVGTTNLMQCGIDSIIIKELSFGSENQLKAIPVETMTSKVVTMEDTKSYDQTRHYDAYLRALDMVEYVWEFDADTMITPNTSTTTPPDHLDSGTGKWNETGIPYKWGGKTGLDTKDFGLSASMKSNFIDEINKGDTAGDIDSDGVVGTTAGIDCSGFIIAAFELPYERSATMIKSGNNEFEDYYWITGYGGEHFNAAGTIGVKSGHVFMVETGFEGIYGELLGLNTLESTTDGSEDKTKEYGRSATNISQYGYVPMKLKAGY